MQICMGPVQLFDYKPGTSICMFEPPLMVGFPV